MKRASRYTEAHMVKKIEVLHTVVRAVPSLSVMTVFVSTLVQSGLGRSVPAKLGMGKVVAPRMLLPVALHF